MEGMETGSMLLNAGVQVLNIIIFFIAFRYFFGKGIKIGLQKKRALLLKLDNADEVYQKMLDEANDKKQALIDEGLQHKSLLVEEAKILAEKRNKELLENAKIQAEHILHEATKHAEQMKYQLEEGFIHSVKDVSGMIVKKLFKKDVQLNEEYMEMLAREFSA